MEIFTKDKTAKDEGILCIETTLHFRGWNCILFKQPNCSDSCYLNQEGKSSINRKNNIGPKIDACGTPDNNGLLVDTQFSMTIETIVD